MSDTLHPRALAEVAATPSPAWLADLRSAGAIHGGWRDVLADPRPLVATGVVVADWLEGALPLLIEASDGRWSPGYFAATAGEPPIPDAPGVRAVQLEQLRHALPWVARELDLPPPASSELARCNSQPLRAARG